MFLDEVSEQVYLETHLLLTLFQYGFVDSFKIDSKNVHAIQISTGNQTLQVGPVGDVKYPAAIVRDRNLYLFAKL